MVKGQRTEIRSFQSFYYKYRAHKMPTPMRTLQSTQTILTKIVQFLSRSDNRPANLQLFFIITSSSKSFAVFSDAT